MYTGVHSDITLTVDGVLSKETKFCVGNQLTFTCTTAEKGYGFQWILPPFLDGLKESGTAIHSWGDYSIGKFEILAKEHYSQIILTAFEGIVGEERTVTCRRFGAKSNIAHYAYFTVISE